MTPRQHSGLLVVVGTALALSAVVVPDRLPVQSHTWLGFASVYLVTGLLLEGLRAARPAESVDFRTTVAVALVAVAVPVGLQAWSLHTNPLRSLSDLPTVARSFQLLVPYAVAFLTPMGVATTRGQQTVVAVVVFIPFVLAALAAVAEGWAFGPGSVVAYHALFLVGSLVVGVPLFVYGRSLRTSASPPKPPRTTETAAAVEEP